MKVFLDFLDGKKTYLAEGAVLLAVFGVWQKWWVMPAEAYAALFAIAIGFLRLGVAKGGGDDSGGGTGAAGTASPVTNSAPRGNLLGVLMVVLGAGLLAAAVIGCASLNATAFNSEKLAADSTATAVHSFNIYYRSATNGAAPEELTRLETERRAVYGASRRVGSTLEMVEELRREYAVNQNSTNLSALQLGLRIAADQASNVAWTVQLLIGQREAAGVFTALPLTNGVGR